MVLINIELFVLTLLTLLTCRSIVLVLLTLLVPSIVVNIAHAAY